MNDEIYINWNAHAPNNWKIKRAKAICYTKEKLIEETKRLEKVFQERNQYCLFYCSCASFVKFKYSIAIILRPLNTPGLK